MKQVPHTFPFLSWPEAIRLQGILLAAGVKIRAVGGCVRDALLGRPIGDVDFATPAPPEKITEICRKAGLKVIPTGLAHGTVTVRVGQVSFEVTTLRRDIACDGRHARVEYTNRWEEDAARRDFTINALYVDFSGNMTDYHDGEKDIARRRLTFIGDAPRRIEEDALRILRLFRFQSQFGFTPDAASLAACKQQSAMIDRLSGERIQQEMFKLLATPDPEDALLAMEKYKVLGMIGLTGVDLDLSAQILREQALKLEPSALIRLAFMLSAIVGVDERRARVAALKARWVLANQHVNILHLLLLSPLMIDSNSDLAVQKKNIRAIGKEHYPAWLAIRWAEEARRNGDSDQLFKAYQRMAGFADHWPIPDFPVSGDDLIARGLPEGERLGRTLKTLEAEWEAGDYQLGKAALLQQLVQE